MRACAACACGSVGGSFVSSSETEVASPRTKRNAEARIFSRFAKNCHVKLTWKKRVERRLVTAVAHQRLEALGAVVAARLRPKGGAARGEARVWRELRRGVARRARWYAVRRSAPCAAYASACASRIARTYSIFSRRGAVSTLSSLQRLRSSESGSARRAASSSSSSMWAALQQGRRGFEMQIADSPSPKRLQICNGDAFLPSTHLLHLQSKLSLSNHGIIQKYSSGSAARVSLTALEMALMVP